MSNLSPEGSLRKQTPRGPLDGLSILYVFDEQKLRFRFWTGNPPFWNPRKPLLSGWVGGWVGGWVVIFWVLRFSSFWSIITSKMRWFQIWCQKLSTAFLSKVMHTLNFKTRQKKTTYLCGKRLKKFTNGKYVSAPRKVSEVFQKIPIEKMRFQVQKYEKYLKSKNDIKKPLGLFNKELWAI